MRLTAYPSRHLATQALCRMYDNGDISFDTWLDCKIHQGLDGLWYLRAVRKDS